MAIPSSPNARLFVTTVPGHGAMLERQADELIRIRPARGWDCNVQCRTCKVCAMFQEATARDFNRGRCACCNGTLETMVDPSTIVRDDCLVVLMARHVPVHGYSHDHLFRPELPGPPERPAVPKPRLRLHVRTTTLNGVAPRTHWCVELLDTDTRTRWMGEPADAMRRAHAGEWTHYVSTDRPRVYGRGY